MTPPTPSPPAQYAPVTAVSIVAKGDLANETANYDEPEVYVIEKSSPGEQTGFISSRSQASD